MPVSITFRLLALLIIFSATPLVTSLTPAIQAAPQLSNAQEGELAIEGEVVDTFTSTKDRGETLVQVLVSASRVGTLTERVRSLPLPAPGQPVYVHVGRGDPLPKTGDTIAARLRPGNGARWEPVGRDWLDAAVVSARPADGRVAMLGLAVEPEGSGRQTALKVLAVDPNGVAGKAGVEVGDLLSEANGIALRTAADLTRAATAADGQLRLMVRDVRTGREVPVDLEWQAEMQGRGNRPVELGVTTEVAFLGGEPVLKITQVAPRSPAARAGLKEGWLIVEAGGTSTESDEILQREATRARGTLELVVFNPEDRSRQRITVELN